MLSDDQPKIEIGNRAGRNHILGTPALPFNALLVTALPDPRMTMRYTHVISEDSRKIAARLGELLTSPEMMSAENN